MTLTLNITPRTAGELVGHEAIVLEAYKDSVGVWTWGVGVTSAAGVNVLGYKDNPSTVETALREYVRLLRTKYGPAVERAFQGREMTEEQFAAALSFHYNTGAIERTDWLKLWLAGKVKEARQFLVSHYLNGGTLLERREREADLFFDKKWSGDGTALVIPVSKPSYQPAFSRAKRVNIVADLKKAMA